MNWDRPLCFTPLYQTRVWGGRNLETLYRRTLPDAGLPYGESWEVSDRAEAQSVVREGEAEGLSLHDLWTQHREAVFGAALVAHPAPRFPLLMKILDACDDLSIQVHPPAHAAAELGGEPKTEMWYMTQVAEGACLYAGLRAGVTREDFEKALANGTVADVMHTLRPAAGDCLFLPSGRVHAIGAGLVIFEIQQNSDTTYRVFDWNRVGLDGKPRALHVEESLKSMDFTDHEPGAQAPGADGTLVRCPEFDVRLAGKGQEVLGRAGEGLTVAVVSGALNINGCTLHAGDFAVIPAALSAELRVLDAGSREATWLEIRLPAA